MTQICVQDLFINGRMPIDRKYYGKNCVEIMKRLAVPMNDVLSTCYFGNSLKKCNEIFSETLTEDGFCYTFNIASSDQIFNQNILHSDYNYIENGHKIKSWCLEKGYSHEENFSEFPWRVLGAGEKTGLEVLLRTKDSDIDHKCRAFSQGFKVGLYRILAFLNHCLILDHFSHT